MDAILPIDEFSIIFQDGHITHQQADIWVGDSKGNHFVAYCGWKKSCTTWDG